MKELMIFIAALTAVLLTACGGGGGGVSMTPPTCSDTEILENNLCRPITANDCRGATPIFADDKCRARMASDCRGATPVLDKGECRARTVNDCTVAAPVFERGECRARIARDCSGATPIFDNGECVAISEYSEIQPACNNGVNDEFCNNAGDEYVNNYGLANINAQAAYSAGYFGQGVTVAVVDSGMRVTHEDLRDNVVAGYDFVSRGTEITDTQPNGGHGTLVGGIIAAERGNYGGSIGTHGVAPAAKLMPLKISDSSGRLVGNDIKAIRYAADNGAHIINNSYGISYELTLFNRGRTVYLTVPSGFQQYVEGDDFVKSYATNILGNIKDADTVLVWAAGNDGWNPEGMVEVCVERWVLGFISTCPVETQKITRQLALDALTFPSGTTLSEFFEFIPYDIELFGSLEGELPFHVLTDFELNELIGNNNSEPARANSDFMNIITKWSNVVALDDDNTIADYSNGCGFSFAWCISAPGTRIDGPSATADNYYYTASGTSFAAPHVSGALAVIKSVIPEMPMSAINFLLLTTATDLGDEGIDFVYGHGALNLEAAVSAAINMQTPGFNNMAAIPFAALRQELPARYDYLPNRLQGVSVAIQITDDSYYNVGLSDMISAEEQESDIGDGAAEILRPAATDSPPGFFAYGDINSQIGMRYVGNISGVSFMSDIRHTATDTDFVGGDLGVLGAIDGKSNAGEIQFRRYLNDNFAVFGGYEYLDINATADEGHLISAIDNVRADGYNVGFFFGNLWRFGDQFSLSAKQKTALSDGELTIRYPHAIGNLHAAFYGNRQNIEIHEATISLRQKTPIILTAGYRQPLNAKSEWAAALEYNGKAAAMSLQYKGEF